MGAPHMNFVPTALEYSRFSLQKNKEQHKNMTMGGIGGEWLLSFRR